MVITNVFQRAFNCFFILGLVTTIVACGGGSSKKTTPASAVAVSSSTSIVNSAASSSTSLATFLMGGAIQGAPLNIATVVTTLAGAPPGANGTGTSVRFDGPKGIVSDGTNLYITDTDNDAIRKIEIATNTVSRLRTLIDTSGDPDGTRLKIRLSRPHGITIVGDDLYVTERDNHTVRKIVIATGEVITIAGKDAFMGSSDGIGTAARFTYPTGLTTDGINLYVADSVTIRKIVIATGEVSTFAGAAGVVGSNDGTGTAASFHSPSGITTDGTNLYVADSSTIRKVVIATGAVTTLTGLADVYGSVDGIGAAARFNRPQALSIDGPYLYVADTQGHAVRKVVISSGEVTTLAGTADTQGAVDGVGAGARFTLPVGIANLGANIYVVDGNDTIRKVAIATGAVTSFAGSPTGTDGTGAAARLKPIGTTTDGTNLYIVDNQTVRKVVIATGVVTTIAGTTGIRGGNDGIGTAARFDNPLSITNDGTYLYVTDSGNYLIRKIEIATAAVTTLAGTEGIRGSADGIGAKAQFNYPNGITTDGTNLFVADTGEGTIRKIVIQTGEVSTLAGTAGLDGNPNAPGAAPQSFTPEGITTEGTHLYVTDVRNDAIHKIVIASGAVTTLAGVVTSIGFVDNAGFADGVGAAARFDAPRGIITDGTNLYVADQNNRIIRKIEISTGLVTTLSGTAGVAGSVNGTGGTTSFYQPADITTDGFSLFVTDYGNDLIRKIQ
ncbi:MAG: hypothetical protein V4660_12515 [Pseudomonadota bacterium]